MSDQDAPGIEHDDWLAGDPMDPAAQLPDPLPPLPGIPFCHRGAGVLISGPTGGGRSSLVQACAYDAAKQGLRVGYLGSEVPYGEFQARAAQLADLRGDTVTDELRAQLAHVRYLDLFTVVTHAWNNPKRWVASAIHAFDIVIGDPFSAVASATGLNFDKNNSEFATFYDRLIQPYVTAGGTFIGLDNVGHALEAQERAKGASAKQDRADLAFSCKRHDKNPEGLLITAQKVRSIRASFHRGDKWLFDRDTQTIVPLIGNSGNATTTTWRPTVLMKKVSDFIEGHPGAGKGDIRQGVTGKNDYVDKALNMLIAEGYVAVHPVGAKDEHHLIRPFDDTEDGQPCPDLAPTTLPPLPQLAPAVPQACPKLDGDLAPLAYTKGKGQGHQGAAQTPDDRTEQLALQHQETSA